MDTNCEKTNCGRDLMCLVKLIKDVFNIECEYKYYHPKNFKALFHYKCYEIQVYTCVDEYRENYENDGDIIIDIIDERIKKNERINNLDFEPTHFTYLLMLYDNISYNAKFNIDLFKEYLYILKEYMDDDKIYFVLSDIKNKKHYMLYRNKLKELKFFISYSDYYIRYTTLYDEKTARRILKFGRIYEDDCLYDIEKLRKRHSKVRNKKLREDLDFLKKSIIEIFGNIKINDSTEIKESVYNTIDFEYKNYLIDISSYFDERHGKTYDEAEYQINIDLLDKDNIYKEELLIGANFADMLAMYSKESFNMKFNKELYMNYLSKVKEYIDRNEVYTFILNGRKGSKYKLYKSEKIKLKNYKLYDDTYKDNIDLFGEENAKEIEKHKPIYE